MVETPRAATAADANNADHVGEHKGVFLESLHALQREQERAEDGSQTGIENLHVAYWAHTCSKELGKEGALRVQCVPCMCEV